MDFITVAPSETFISVLEELSSCPGAPKAIVSYFSNKSVRSDKKKGKQSQRTNESKTQHDESESSNYTLALRTSDVKWCHEKMKQRGIPHRIHQLLNESSIIWPKPEQDPPSSPEYKARIEKLRHQANNRAYDSMVHNLNVDPGYRGPVTGLGREIRMMHTEVNRQLVSGMQYLISIVGTFFAVFWGLYFFGIPDYPTRLLCGIVGALMVAVAEIYFIIREDLKLEHSKLKSE